MELDHPGLDDAQAASLTERLRSELQRTGRFTLLERQAARERLAGEGIAPEQGCGVPECALAAGRALNVDKVVAGRVRAVADQQWILSGVLVDVKSGATEQAQLLDFMGSAAALEESQAPLLADRLAGTAPAAQESPAALAGQAVPAPTPSGDQQGQEGGVAWWVWLLIGLGVLALASGGGGGGDSGGAPSVGKTVSDCPSGAGNCGSAGITW
jgi:hypothetical protein